MTHTNGNGRSVSERQKFTEEMLTCGPSLKAFAISLTGDEVRAEDLVQQTYLQALENSDQFELGTNMPAWLFTIMRNRFRTEYRKRKREVEWSDLFEDYLPFSTGLRNRADVVLDYRRLLMCIACLPEERRDALIAVGCLGMQYDESAERLGCEIGTVKSRVNRARNELLELLNQAKLICVEIGDLKTATRGVSEKHPFYPIAKAYEDLYADLKDIGNEEPSKRALRDVSEVDRQWSELFASGALDHAEPDVSELMQGDFEP